MEQKIYLRALALIGGVLLGVSVFLSPIYALPPLIAAGLVVYADTRESVKARVAWSIVPTIGMGVAIVWTGLYNYLLPIPGAAMVMTSAVWTMIRQPRR